MVGLHALKGLGEQPAAGHVVSLLLGSDSTGDSAPGPEHMAHRTPWVRGVGTEVCSTILADGEAGGGTGESQVNQAAFVDGRLERVSIAFFVQREGNVVGGKGLHALVEHVVVQRIGEPLVGFAIAGGVEDLAVKLSGSMNAAGMEK